MRISFKRGNLIYLLITGLVYFGAVFVIPSFLSPKISVDTRLKVILLAALVATIIMSLLAVKSRNDLDRGEQHYSIFLKVAIGLAGFLVMMMLQGAVNVFLQYLTRFFEFQTNSQNTSNVVEIIKRMPIFIIYVAVLGPIMEEFFFRKAVFGYFYDIMLGSKEWIRFLIPGLITGVLFAIPHDGFSPIMVIYIAMSLVFSYLYMKTKSIITPIVSHIVMNTLVVIIQLAVNN